MKRRTTIPPEIVADVVTASRRRCCVCFALHNDAAEKKGQISHLDDDPSNNALENLAFLCLEHHDQYDSRTSQSKGLTIEEVKRYRAEISAFIARQMPPPDNEIVALLTRAFDRPAFRTPFRHESSLPRFREAIAETIETLNTGRTPQRVQGPSKFQVRDSALREDVDGIVEALAALRAAFDDLLRRGLIRPCGCGQADCPVFMFSEQAVSEMDSRRRKILELAHALNPNIPHDFYDFG